jgi:hypothetical protein
VKPDTPLQIVRVNSFVLSPVGKPELAMTQNQMLRREPEGNW